jgi:hypothetical protein
LFNEIQNNTFVFQIKLHKKLFLVMKFFKIILLLLLPLFGVALEGFGQNSDCEECRPQNNQRNNFIIQEAYLSDSTGVRLTAQQCNNSVPVSEFWITLNYTSRQELDNVKLLFDLLINNSSGDRIDSLNIEYFVGTVASTSPGQQNSVTIRIDLGSKTFNCSNQVLELLNTRAFWTSNANLNPSGQCGGYAAGLCSNPPLIIIPVGVDGFIYDFDYVLSCVRENEGSIDVTFFVTTLAGGTRPAVIEWEFDVNGNPIDVNPNGGFSYTIFDLDPKDKIIPGLLINNKTSDSLFTIPPIITIPDLFNIESSFTNDDQNVSLAPNGSIVIDDIDPDSGEYLFFWTDEDGNILNSEDPKNLTGLTGGVYSLTMIDQESGVCILYEFILDAIPLPVLFEDMSINFNNSERRIEFNWATSKEWENSHFEVQRSFQNLNNWTVVGKVEGMGFSDEPVHYKFEDKDLPLVGGNLYYRLRQVDYSGTSELTKVLSVRTPGLHFTQGVWRAFPNPTHGEQLKIGLLDRNEYNGERLTFRIIQTTSVSESITVSDEAEMNEILSTMIPKISKGLFVVEIRWGQKVEHIKVLRK